MTDDAPAEVPQTTIGVQPRSKGSKWAHRGLRLVALIVLLPVVFAVIATIAVVDRNITAPTWIKTTIEDRAAEALNGGSLSFGEITVNLGRDLHPRVQLSDTVLRDADGATIARIAQVSGLMSPRGLFFRREALMQDLQLRGTQINLRRNADGTVALSFQSGATDVGEAAGLIGLLDQTDAVFEQPALEALETVQASGLIINFQDARAGRSWTVDDGRLSLDLRGGRTELRGDMAVLSRGGVTSLALSYASARGSRAAAIGLEITDAASADIATQSAALSWLSGITAPISANLRTTLDDQGNVGPLNGALTLGRGALQPNPGTAPIGFESAKAYLSFDPATNVISFDEMSIQSDWGEAQAAGQALLTDLDGGLPAGFISQFTLRNMIFDPPGVYDASVQIDAAQIDLRLGLAPFTVDIGQLFVQAQGVDVLATGNLIATPEGWDIGLDVQVPQASQPDLMALWPPGAITVVRDWFDAALQTELSNLAVGVRVPPGQPPIMAGSFEFADTQVQVMRTLPLIQDGAGVASFAGGAFHLSLERGHVIAPEGGRLDLAGSVMTIPDLRPRVKNAVYDLELGGSVTAALSILDQPPFRYLSKANLPVTLLDGRAQVSAQIAMPIKRVVTGDEVNFDVTARLRDVRSTRLVPNRTLVASRLALTADKAGMTVTGAASLDGVPISGNWRQSFRGEGGRLRAEVGLSQDALDSFNIGLPRGSVSGRGVGDLDLLLVKDQAPRFTLTSNLRGLQVAIPPIGWAKPAATPGSLSVTGQLGPVPRIEELAISGGGLNVRGDIRFREGGGLDRARFSQVSVGNWLNAPITLRGRGAGRPVGVEINGGSVDLRQARFGASSGDSGPLTIALDRLQVTSGIAISRFVGEFTGRGGFAGRFGGMINGRAAVQGTVAPQNGRSAVRLVSDDAGAVISAMGFMKNAVGGSLDLTLLPAGGEGTFDGALAIRSLRVRDAPAMAALLDAVSVVGLLQQLDGQGLSFDEVDARFRLNPRQVILTQSSAIGPGLGISLDGIYTLANKQMDFQGVLSPLYLINSIGSIFTRRGEGLIGFSFNIAGTSDAPSVSVNPFSALTPGMFREIFRRPVPEVSP